MTYLNVLSTLALFAWVIVKLPFAGTMEVVAISLAAFGVFGEYSTTLVVKHADVVITVDVALGVRVKVPLSM
jgi:hypothetical protein